MSAPKADHTVASSSHPPGRGLGFWELVACGLAYIAPMAPLITLGLVWQASHGLIALAYAFGGVCMYFTGKSYAMMVCEVRTAGSVYGFARYVLGPSAGFLAGWMILLDYLLIPAYVYVATAVAMEQIFPGVSRVVWIVLLVVVPFTINWFGITSTSKASAGSVVIQIGIILAVLGFSAVALAHGYGSGGFGLAPLYDSRGFSAGAIFSGTSICVMSYLGFDAISTLAEDTRDPTGRTLGRAIIYVLVLATVLFVLTTWILGNLMIGTPITDPAGAAYELLGKTVGAWAAIALAWAVTIVAGFTNAVPMQVGVAKVLFAMGRDRQLFSCFARVHPKYQTPWIAMLVATAISVVAAVFMRNLVDELASTVNFGALLGFLMLHISVLVHFGVRKRSRRWIQHWVIPLAGIGVVLAVLWGMGTLAMTIGMSWLLGGTLYTLFLRSRRIGAVVGA